MDNANTVDNVASLRQASLSWIPSQNGQAPYNGIQADTGLYIARARTGGEVAPGKVKVGYNTGFFPSFGKEDCIASYEILCDTGLHVFGPETVWIESSNGSVPPNAVVGGHTGNNEPLYIARGRVNGEMCVGKVCQSHGCAFMPYGCAEHKIYNYEVFCYYH